MQFIRFVIIAFSVCLLCSTVNADWPQWRGPDQTGYVDCGPLVRELPKDGLKALWKFDGISGGDSGGWSSPVIADGCVYVYAHTKEKNSEADLGEEQFPWLAPDKRGHLTDAEYEEYEVKRRDENERRAKAFRFEERLVCIDLISGETKWDHRQDTVYTRFTQSSTPAVIDGRVFVLSPKRTASCFDAKTGEVLWAKKLPGDFRDEFFSSSFVVSGNTALVACGPLVALNTSDGALVWQGDTPLDYQSHSSPVVWQSGQGAVVIANTQDGKTEAYQVNDGKKLWTIDSGASQSTPIVTGDLLLTYGGSRKSGLQAFALNAATPEKEPEQLWVFQGAADQGSSPVVIGNFAFVQGEKRIAKVDLETGKARWQETLKVSNPRYTSLVAAGDQLLYGWEGLLAIDVQSDDYTPLYDAEVTSDGRLIAGGDLRVELGLDKLGSTTEDLSAAEKTWQREAVSSGPVACTTPALSDGKIVLRLKRSLVCFDLMAK